MQPLQRFHDWLVWSAGRTVYAVLFVFALVPFAVALRIGTWKTITLPPAQAARISCPAPPCTQVPATKCKVVWKGLDQAVNWWIWPIVLPLSLWYLRRAGRVAFGPDAAIMEVVASEDRALARHRLDEIGHDPRSTAGVLIAMVPIIIVEFWSVGAAYLTSRCPKEKDWTIFFMNSYAHVTRPANLVHVVIAYIAQYAAGFFGILAFVLFFRHNWVYLRWIYQRHRRNRGTPRIELDFDDQLDCCFGQQKMRRVFNLQVWVLVATGLAIVVSRAVNVATAATAEVYDAAVGAISEGVNTGFFFTVLRQLTKVSWHAVYNDGGQIILVVMFVIVFAFVASPSLVKFLPFRAGRLREGGAKRYLAEFIPAGHKNDPDRLKDAEIGALAKSFRANSFWPAGDNVAQLLFAFVFAVLLFVLLPVPAWKADATIVYFAILAISAVSLTAAAFVAYKVVLGYVAKILVKGEK